MNGGRIWTAQWKLLAARHLLGEQHVDDHIDVPEEKLAMELSLSLGYILQYLRRRY